MNEYVKQIVGIIIPELSYQIRQDAGITPVSDREEISNNNKMKGLYWLEINSVWFELLH
jgi:hypothetical protein